MDQTAARWLAKALPKVELHAHLSGSIDRDCLHEIWTRRKQADDRFDLHDPLDAIPPGKVDYDLNT
ncbi:hypothetical protein SLS58_003542 [Diplodia intermedia]|uniref:Adenosine deaminase n=1 Tax=Diplodia intermedia TaxID=856260 RepID=A0ABR3TX69_9PEZI